MGKWLLLAILIALLVIASLLSYWAWNLPTESEMSGHGYMAMTLGIILSLGIGCGLMALVFYSNRKGYDERASGSTHDDNS